ncbi:hypothetical protein GIY23_19255 [Allosaccharopolyspora coralli]|uniref:Uncharacterized protein n=1 Tax=Allosaccharopolyspora coralli TaxID=2665642 RepID=A0A5Q3Q9X8_9PSEU|nr:hypothetical protein [Allosaccharopolyspora coralli]QGK71368.1 hypothetical protein GIY23_19255 [Allosaccharopolyspora coralli]
MRDPDEWRARHVHWHVYMEARASLGLTVSGRDTRLRQEPDLVLTSPDDVADWIAGMTSEHAHRRHVRMIGSECEWGEVGDDSHIDHDLTRNLEIACRGDSIYADFERENDRLHLWLEAVTPEECHEHSAQPSEVTP